MVVGAAKAHPRPVTLTLTDNIADPTCPGIDTQNQPPDLTLQLPRDVYHLVVFTLRGMLPPPETDTPEAEARRDRAAIALVASMLPSNSEEAHLAARSVGLAIYAMDCLRQARDYRGGGNAQAVSTERKAQAPGRCCCACRPSAASARPTTPLPTRPPGPSTAPSA